MPYDVGIAQRLRDAGLTVKECSGWKSRGNSSGGNFHPKGLVVHHTAGAGPEAGVHPSLNTLIHGRPDLAGPLANISMDYEGVLYAIAAGAANHAGTPDGGSWKGMTGNSSAWGFEIEHPGTYALDSKRVELAARAVAAMVKGTCDESMVPYHKEWAPSRKIDLDTSPSPSTFRQKVAGYLKGGFLMALSDKEQQELYDNAKNARQFASGVQQYFEAFKNNDNRVEGLEVPSTIDTAYEWAGWKLADRIQNTRLDVKESAS